MQLQAKQLHNKFKFKCTKCGQCCDKTMIALYPFDIRIICDHLNISTTQFHEKYSAFTIDNENIVRCFLRNRPRCPFKDVNNKCSIYDFRPVRCRLYPIGRFFQEDQTHYLVANDPSPGFNSNKKQSIAEWLEEQGVTKYDPLTERWNHFLIKLKNHPQINEEDFQMKFKEIFYNFVNNDEELESFMDLLYLKFGI
ncbi:MAG: YkgJ family cysteine cluster protein [Candidatus Woesearchaeota archaeon]